MNAVAQLDQLQHGDRHVRDEAFDRIARSRDLALLEPLSELAQPDSGHLETLFCQYLRNIPFEQARPHLRRLLHSRQTATRKHAIDALSTVDIEQRLELLIELLNCPHRDVQLHAIGELGIHRRSVALGAIRPLLVAGDQELGRAAFAAIQRIDAPRAIRTLLPFLEDPEPWRRIAALEALGNMATFNRWKRFLPCLEDEDPRVRRTAIFNLSRKGQGRANAALLARLDRETDEEVCKLIINRLALYPDPQMVRLLLRIAAGHEELQVRRSAGWVIEELDEELLRQAMRDLLPDGDEELQAYILTKMGTRQLPDCGRIIASYLAENRPARVRYAALESLGFLRQPEFLPAVVPHLQSGDPMTAYIATLSATQMVRSLEDCPELTEILLSPDGEHIALKQVVLQYMIEAISWNFDDPTLFRVLVSNLQSSNENISYLSAILLGNCRGEPQLVSPLLKVIFEDPSPDLRQASRDALDQVLDGDLSPLFDLLVENQEDPDLLCTYAGLMAGLRWNSASAARGLELFSTLPCPVGLPQTEQFQRDIARGLYRANPQACRDFFARTPSEDHWHLAVGHAWLEGLNDLNRTDERSDWQHLFAEADPGLVRAAIARAIDAGARWTAEAMIDRTTRNPDDPLAPELRRAVRELLEM